MLTLLHLKIFTVFSSFPLIIGDDSQSRTTSVDNDHIVADGEQYIKRIAHGEKIPETPEILMFTAPYKLCEGGCKGSEGGVLALGFPIYIGRRGMAAYKNIYLRDSKKINTGTGAPFRKKTTRPPLTTCKIVQVIVSTVPPPTTPRCPLIVPGMCMKRNKKNTTTTHQETSASLNTSPITTLTTVQNNVTTIVSTTDTQWSTTSVSTTPTQGTSNNLRKRLDETTSSNLKTVENTKLNYSNIYSYIFKDNLKIITRNVSNITKNKGTTPLDRITTTRSDFRKHGQKSNKNYLDFKSILSLFQINSDLPNAVTDIINFEDNFDNKKRRNYNNYGTFKINSNLKYFYPDYQEPALAKTDFAVAKRRHDSNIIINNFGSSINDDGSDTSSGTYTD